MEISVLFVDDESNVINGIKRMLFKLKKTWKMHFALSGAEALKLLETNTIDVIVTDMRMPIMTGADLLEKVKDLYPQMVRMVLSGHADEELSIRATKVAHQFLAKPCSPDILKSKIEKTYLLRNFVKDEKLIRIISGIGNLPSMPDVYLKLEREISSKNVSIQSINNIISQDSTLTAKILQMVNSAFFGLPTKITNSIQAVSILGINTIKSLVLFNQIYTQKFAGSSKKLLEELWTHNLKVACLSKEIIRNFNKDKHVADQTYIAGLLHDIGKLVLLKNGLLEKSIALKNEKEISNLEAEMELIGTDHSRIGAYLIGLWGLDDGMIEVVAFHHDPENIVNTNFCPLHAVHIANAVVNAEKTVPISSFDELPDLNKNVFDMFISLDLLNEYIEFNIKFEQHFLKAS